MAENHSHKYDDIIDLPHHVSQRRSRMSMTDRGAQFSPFAALTGYDAAIRETARLTEQQVVLTEEEKSILNRKLLRLAQRQEEQPEVELLCFQPDQRKEGGAYVRLRGRVKRVDDYLGVLVLVSGEQIPFDRILEIHGDGL